MREEEEPEEPEEEPGKPELEKIEDDPNVEVGALSFLGCLASAIPNKTANTLARKYLLPF